ncbi:MAG: hypothetical protein RML45_10770 [Acetobacteraceae bacterium]|nr:hypothetical protein [Acetobacteraceae bacterium]
MRAPVAPATLRDLVADLARFGDKPALVQMRGGKGEPTGFAAIGEAALRACRARSPRVASAAATWSSSGARIRRTG